MKLAWLCWTHSWDSDDPPIILFSEPDENRYSKVVRIVYAEIVE